MNCPTDIEVKWALERGNGLLSFSHAQLLWPKKCLCSSKWPGRVLSWMLPFHINLDSHQSESPQMYLPWEIWETLLSPSSQTQKYSVIAIPGLAHCSHSFDHVMIFIEVGFLFLAYSVHLKIRKECPEGFWLLYLYCSHFSLATSNSTIKTTF